MGNLNSFQARYLALRKSMFIDGRSFGLPLHDEDLHTISERIRCEGTSFVKVTLPLLGKALDQGLVSWQFNCITNFALKRNTYLPQFLYSVFSRVFDDEGILRSSPCVTSIQFLRQFLLFDSKLFSEPTPKQKELAISGFVSRMEALKRLRLPKGHPVLDIAQELIGKNFHDLNLSNIVPGHGPGSVAEGKSREEKWIFDTWPAKAERQYPFLLYGTHSLRAQLERGQPITLVRDSATRCCLVPKDFRGPRLISAEPTVNQYLQQGQMKAIMEYISRKPLLARSIKMKDQTFNQRAARTAYQQGQVTLDLSDASDTVSVALVWHLFAKVPDVRRKLMATRSQWMQIPGGRVRLYAFAPMGSAVCFPVETIVFWALTMASCMLSSYHPSKNIPTRSFSEIGSEVRVFGDDIIFPEYAYDTLIGTLLSVGCKPNMSKTCRFTPFRESCGSEWYDGIDVSLIRNRQYQYQALSVNDHPVLCDLQRKFFLHKWFCTAALCKEWSDEILPTPSISLLHYFHSEDLDESVSLSRSYLRTTRFIMDKLVEIDYFDRKGLQPDKFYGHLALQDSLPRGLRVRYNKSLQRIEYRTILPYQKQVSWTIEGYPRLLARLLDDTSDRIALRHLQVRMAWVALPLSSLFQENKG